MDLLRCTTCLRRFLARNAEETAHPCPACGGELQLMVRSIPGPPERASAALGAKILEEPLSPQEAGP